MYNDIAPPSQPSPALRGGKAFFSLNSLPPRSAGFTLLEILIALFIFTIISIIMATTLHTVFTSQSGTEKKAAKIAKLQMTLLILSRDFEQSIDRPVTNAKNMQENAFIGTPRMVTLTHGGLKNPAGETQRTTLQRTQYSLQNQQLIRESWNVLDQTAKTVPEKRVLYQGVMDLRFEYLDAEGKFQNNWPVQNSQNALPVAIRVSLSLQNWGKITQLYLLKGQNVSKNP